MTWRGLESPPYDAASFSGSFSLAERRYPYINGAAHENVGRDPSPMNFRLHFLNNLGKNYFPELFNKWLNAVAVDDSPGKLQHPVFGFTLAYVKTWSVDLSAARTSGAILQVSFIETLSDPASAVQSLFDVDFRDVTLTAAAEAADQDYSKLGLPLPPGMPETSLLDMVKKIDGLVSSSRNTVEGYLNQSLGMVETIIETAESVGSNATWALAGNLITLWNGIKLLADRNGINTRAIARKHITFKTNLDRVAEETGNTVGELIGLNPGILNSPTIPRSTLLKPVYVLYYSDKKFNAEIDSASDNLGV